MPLVVDDSMNSVSPSTGRPVGCIGEAGPGVDDELAVEVGRHLKPDLWARVYKLPQDLLDRGARVIGHSHCHRLAHSASQASV